MSEVSSPILLISGPPGAGKSTIARALVATATTPLAFVEGDSFWSHLARPLPAESPEAARAGNAKLIVQAMVSSAVRYARGGYDTIVDFSLGPWAISGIVAKLKRTPVDLVILCPSLAVCAARVAARCDGAADYSRWADFHGAFAARGIYDAHTLRDDDASVDELVARIRTGLAAGAWRVTAPAAATAASPTGDDDD